MTVELYEHQKLAIEQLKPGSILCGGVGSGKSRTALTYYFVKECGGKVKVNGQGGYSPMKKPKDLYIITTARKRDLFEWEHECSFFRLSSNPELNVGNVKVTIDSWNNIGKYAKVKYGFFIFDEQRLVGSGSWVKSFIEITKTNSWILLSATPGDTWLDYIPVFVANGFYKNRTEFLRRHVVYSRFAKYPKVERYIETNRLEKLKQEITVYMQYVKSTIAHNKPVVVSFNKELFEKTLIKRWNVFENKPIKNVSELCYLMRRVVNTDKSRIESVKTLIEKHRKTIIFYNFNYELEILRTLGEEMNCSVAEWNGHKHEEIPKTDRWVYLVQYTSGAEGWNCVETNCIIFYSQNYSYRTMLQAAGRIDRLNTLFKDLYYYHLRSNSIIDLAISKALERKQNFNEHRFMDI
jgi:hypothetical protein